MEVKWWGGFIKKYSNSRKFFNFVVLFKNNPISGHGDYYMKCNIN